MPSADRRRAIAYIKDCRRIHQDYARFLERHKPSDPNPQGSVGNSAWHRMWERRYATVLRVLRES